MKDVIDQIIQNGTCEQEVLTELLQFRSKEGTAYLYEKAAEKRTAYTGNQITVTGVIHVSSYCRNDCRYCPLQRSNVRKIRYRLEESQILGAVHRGYEQGIRSFLFEGGDDPYFSETRVIGLVRQCKEMFPGIHIILAFGERSYNVLKKYGAAGAEAYLLREETANEKHYRKIHPSNMSPLRRRQCLWEAKELGIMTGAGFLVGTPWQMLAHVSEDLLFLQKLQPSFVSIDAFVPQAETVYAKERGGSAEMVLYIMALLRIMLPKAAIVAPMSISDASTDGRLRAVDVCADMVFVDLTKEEDRRKYLMLGNRSSKVLTLSELEQQLEGKGFICV